MEFSLHLVDAGFIILVSLFSIYVLFIRESRNAALLKKFPGDISLPFVGHAWKLLNPTNFLNVFIQWHLKYGSRCRADIGPLKFISLCNPVDIEKVMNSPAFLGKSDIYANLRDWLGDGLIFSSGTKWSARRKLITPSFHFKILDTFQAIIDEQSNILVNIIKGKIASGQECEMQELFSRLSLDIICETAMGTSRNCQLDSSNSFLKATTSQAELFLKRSYNPLLQNALVWNFSRYGKRARENVNVLHEFTNQVIKDRKALFRSRQEVEAFSPSNTRECEADSACFTEKPRFAFLDILIQAQLNPNIALTDEDIKEEVDTFMFAGHDTTASAMSFCLYLLGRDAEAQARAQSEVDDVLGTDLARPILSADIPKLKFLEMCIKEALRIYATVPLISRKAMDDFKIDGEHVIPKGTNVILNIYAAHQNPAIFPDPQRFNPERFSTENCAQRHSHSFLVFSAGNRNCIGQRLALAELKTTLANILRNFQVSSMDAPEILKIVPDIVMRSSIGIRVKFAPRNVYRP